jgi:hypothetical protein
MYFIMHHKFKFLGFLFIFSNFLVPANALLLCKTFSWSYDTGLVGSPSGGWAHTYTWSTGVITIPYCGVYSVSIYQWSGDNDGDWWHQKGTTYTATLGAGTQIYANGQVKQVAGNSCLSTSYPGWPCPWAVNTQLIVGGTQVASLSDSGTNSTDAHDTDIDRGRVEIIVSH